MSTQTANTSETVTFSTLAQMRDELRLQIHLAKAEARAEWDRLETKWKELEHKRPAVETASTETGQQIASAFRHLMKEIEEGYERIKQSL